MEFYATLGDPCARRDILDKLFRAVGKSKC